VSQIADHVKLGSGWQFCPIVRGGTGKIRPDLVLVRGVEEVHPEGRFYLDFYKNGKRVRRSAGVTAAEALAAAAEQNKSLMAHDANKKAGITLPEPETTGGRSLEDAVTTYLLEIFAHKKPKTHSAYELALRYFLESCHKTTLEQITRADLLAFRTYLVAKKQSDRSQWNKFASVMSFLKQNKITGLVSKNDWPSFTEEEVSTYTKEELKSFSRSVTKPKNFGSISSTSPQCANKRS
jgi:integrase/recombinase XerD